MSLVDADKQWFKSRYGFETQETSRDVSFCAHVITTPEPLIIEDALLDERFKSNPLVVEEPKISLYAGFPLQTPNDQRIGTLCVIDRKPGHLSDLQHQIMEALSRQVVSFLELRKRSICLLDALSNINKMEGIITKCSYCKEVRDTNGQWQHLEKYLSKITDIRFSHGVCDSYMEKHFPDVLEIWSDDKLNVNNIKNGPEGKEIK
tara:strand:+ start:1618 stop:2232 length:615 start_codon:yes stop_codon:yes gene_type:complete